MSGTRIGLFCGYLDPTRDGVADYTRRLALGLRGARLDPLVITTHECARSAGEGAVGVTGRWDLRGVAAAARAVRRLDCDLVHVQFAPSAFGFSRAIGLLPLFLPQRIPLLVTLHEYGVRSGPGRGRSVVWTAAERRGYADRETLLLAPRAACVLIPSPEHRDVLQSRFPGHVPITLDVPIGPNVEPTKGDRAEARAAVRREFGAAADAPLVAFFGFLHPEKALDRLITAVAAVRVACPGIHLLLIGGAESHSVSCAAAAELRGALEGVAAYCGVQDRVHFTGYLPGSEVSRLLQAADVAAFPFDAGVTRKSSSLLAALATGLPAVATEPPGGARGPTGPDGVLRVPPRDTPALTDALRRVLGDPALAGRLAASGAVFAASHSWDAVSAVHADVYAGALAGARGERTWTGAAEPSRVWGLTPVEGDADVTA